MKPKKTIIQLVMMGFVICGLPACQSDIEPQVQYSSETSVELTPSEELLMKAVKESSQDGKVYMIYEDVTGEWLVISPEEYEFYSCIADFIESGNKDVRTARKPEGKGWIKGGVAKYLWDAVKVGKSICSKLEAGRDVVIYLEAQKDGSYIVWYRYA